MSRALTIFGVTGLIGLIVYLLVLNQLAEERSARLERELLDAEARIARLEFQRSLVEKQFTEGTKRNQPSTLSSRPRPSTTTSTEVAAGQPAVFFRRHESEPAHAARADGIGESTPGPSFAYTAIAGSVVRIEGTSSIHDWQVESHLIAGSVEFGGGFPPALGTDPKPGAIDAKANTWVTVRSLKSVAADGTPYSDRMDEIMYDALQGQKYSRITFTLASLSQRERQADTNAPLVYEAVGQLAIAGQTNTLTIPVSVNPFPDRTLQLTGSARLKMTDFKITPPSPVFGGVAIKTADEVRVSFVWWVRPRGSLAASR